MDCVCVCCCRIFYNMPRPKNANYFTNDHVYIKRSPEYFLKSRPFFAVLHTHTQQTSLTTLFTHARVMLPCTRFTHSFAGFMHSSAGYVCSSTHNWTRSLVILVFIYFVIVCLLSLALCTRSPIVYILTHLLIICSRSSCLRSLVCCMHLSTYNIHTHHRVTLLFDGCTRALVKLITPEVTRPIDKVKVRPWCYFTIELSVSF